MVSYSFLFPLEALPLPLKTFLGDIYLAILVWLLVAKSRHFSEVPVGFFHMTPWGSLSYCFQNTCSSVSKSVFDSSSQTLSLHRLLLTALLPSCATLLATTETPPVATSEHSKSRINKGILCMVSLPACSRILYRLLALTCLNLLSLWDGTTVTSQKPLSLDSWQLEKMLLSIWQDPGDRQGFRFLSGPHWWEVWSGVLVLADTV